LQGAFLLGDNTMDCIKKIAGYDCYNCPCSYVKNKKIHCGRCEYSNVLKTGKVSCMMPRCAYKTKEDKQCSSTPKRFINPKPGGNVASHT